MPVIAKVSSRGRGRGRGQQEGEKREGAGEGKDMQQQQKEEEEEVEMVVAVLDVDCTVENGFDEVDEEWLGRLAALLARSCDWDIAIIAG